LLRYYVASVNLSTLIIPNAPDAAPAIRSDEAWLELAMRAADMGASYWDIPADRHFLSDRAAAILGARPGARAARGGGRMFRYTHPDDLAWVRKVVLGAVRTGAPYKIEHRVHRGGGDAVIWVLSAGTPVRDENGQVVRLLSVVKDITERKANEARREMLGAELDHRVKNVLASVQSMALQSARRALSLEGFLKTFSGRLKAMASAHTLLTAARWRGAEVRHIVNAELSGLAPRQTHLEGPETALTPRATNALALALHELASNALKFGALSNAAGRVDVQWTRNGRGGLDLDWIESGGPSVVPPARQGFGSILLENVTGRELDGEVRLQFRTTGVWARISSGPEALVLPASTDKAPEVQVEEPPRPAVPQAPAACLPATGLAGLKVLIVEDSLLLALELESGLSEAGAVIVGQAANVDEAMGLVGPDVQAAVLDVDLNGVAVTPVAAALVARGIPFVFATGYGDNDMAPQGFDAPIIRKPYAVTQVAAALADIRRSVQGRP